MKVLALFIIIPAFISGTPFKECGTSGTIKSVQVNDCQTNVCPLIRGQNASITVQFEANEDSSSATSVCHGIIAGLPVPYSLPDTNGCHGMTPPCPIKKGTLVTYKTQLFVQTSYPKIKLLVKWEEQDPNKKDLFCLIFAAEIQ